MDNGLLIASPQMRDPFFERAVVLVWQHDEDGAIGVVVNRTLEEAASRGVLPRSTSTRMGDLLVLDDDDGALAPYAQHDVNWGGPVDTESGTVVTTAQVAEDEGWNLASGVAVTRSQDALVRAMREGATLRLCLGYAGWGRGQLDREIAEGSWLFTEARPELMFELPADQIWERAIRTLGVAPEYVLMSPAEA